MELSPACRQYATMMSREGAHRADSRRPVNVGSARGPALSFKNLIKAVDFHKAERQKDSSPSKYSLSHIKLLMLN